MNGNFQIPTPQEYVLEMLDYAGYTDNCYGKRVLENSSGEGNILIEIIRRYISVCIKEGYSKKEIEVGLNRDIVAFEIDSQKIEICIQRLNSLVKEYSLDTVQWNIHNCDYLNQSVGTFEYIIGNPPYITYHDMTNEQREYLKSTFKSCKKGRCDYCYAFVEKSLDELSPSGIFVYLLPYGVIRNRHAYVLRTMLLHKLKTVYDYTGKNIFPGITTSSVIICCDMSYAQSNIGYIKCDTNQKTLVSKNQLTDQWFFTTKEQYENKFGDIFQVGNSVATLLNEAFLINQYEEDNQYFYVDNCRIEKEIVKHAMSARSAKSKDNDPLIIFPYKNTGEQYERYTEEEFHNKFPCAYKYLGSFRKKLEKRKVSKGMLWFEYGRSQALSNVIKPKIVMPMIITKKVRTYFVDKNVVPYAGYYIICKSQEHSLEEAKKILSSKKFLEYVKNVGTPTTPTSFRISVKDIEEYRY